MAKLKIPLLYLPDQDWLKNNQISVFLNWENQIEKHG